MSRRILGLLSGRRRRALLLATTASLAVLGAFLISNALAVHDLNLFELDRNAQDANPAALPDDWQTLYNGGGSAIAKTAIPVTDNTTPGDQFKTGSSKDDIDVSQWLWTQGEPLDKDDITDAYAAAYVIPPGGGTGQNQAGDTIVYFGLDRFDNSGSAQVGFWFFKDQVAKTGSGPASGSPFSGTHKDGDILVQSNFSNGGVISTVSVYEWFNGALRLLTSSGQDCNAPGAPTDDPVCATVNQSGTPSPWPFTPKSGPAGSFPQGSFFEGGINITRLLVRGPNPTTNPCISTFMAETRSSTPFDARLKDFALSSFPLCGNKSGTKFKDVNGDGVRQPNGADGIAGNGDDEVGLSGWTIKLYKDTNGNGTLDSSEATAVGTQTTDSNGFYKFANIENGKYIVCEVKQSGWNQSLPNSGTSGNADCASQSGDSTLAPNGYAFTMTGADHTGNDFGNYQNGTKSGTKYDDLNANGTRDTGEPGLPGWTIRAYKDTNGDGTLDATEAAATPAASDTTSASGGYSLSLKPGRYVVCEVAQSPWIQSEPANTKCAANSALGNGGYAITVTSNSSETGNNFGNYRKGTKSGTKYDDLNANGTRDSGEPGLPGWTIRAYSDTNGDGSLDATEAAATPAATDTTGAGGGYSLSLKPGKYVVCEVAQSPWTQTEPANTKCAANSALANGGYAITVTSNSSETGNNFGNFRKGTKSGTKYDDLNANGTRDSGEPGLPGWTIRAYADTNGDGSLDATEAAATPAASDTTSASGGYSLSLNPGKYVVCEVAQSPWIQSEPANTKCAANSALGAGGYAITVTSNSSETGNNFGNFRKGTKSGTKYDDLNANGTRDSGEPGLPGWTIRAYADTNGDGSLDATEAAATPAATDTTSGSGGYSLSLNPGRYVVCEVAQSPWIQSEPANTKCAANSALGAGGYAITVTSNSSETGNNFGNFRKGTKSGTKYDDLNANGTRDSGEPGLPGWTIRAYADTNGDGSLDATEAAASPAATDTTSASGGYSLSLNPGKYVVCEVAQSPWIQSEPANTKCAAGPDLANGGYAITVTSNSSETGNNFGNFRKGTKSGTKYDDLNANGTRDSGEPGLPGWTIRAYADTNGDGSLDATEAAATPAATDTTSASGGYSLSLNPGKYVVCEVAQSPWIQSEPANTKCAANSALGSAGYAITVTSNSSETGNNFGNFRKGTKSGTKYDDLNANGTRDSGEPGLPGWTIRAYTDTNGDGTLDATEAAATPAATDTTSASGGYSLSLIPGKYVVCEVAQSPWIQSEPANTKCAANSALGNGGYAITVTSNSSETGNNFGNFRKGTKSGTKYDDLNANGTRDSGEPGLPGWTIRAYADTNGDGSLDATEAAATPAATDTTSASGGYSLSLNPGKYVVCEVAQSPWIQSEPANTECATNPDLGNGGYAITVTSNSSETGNNFGNYRNATITGMKFKDANANHAKDTGEPGLGGWQIHLFGVDGLGNPVHQHTTTAADGTYSFTSVTPGSYTLCETTLDGLNPALNHPGWVQTFPTTGADCLPHMAVHLLDMKTLGLIGYHVTATSGGTHDNNDFGNTPQSRVTVTFESLADLPDGTDATHATKISCVDQNGDPIGSVDNANQLTTDKTLDNQTPVTCTIKYTDP